MNAAVSKVIEALKGHGATPRKSGEGWSCRCPAHEDRRPSLTVGVGENGGAVVCCHAGCTARAIVESIGLTLADLMPPREDAAQSKRSRQPKPKPAKASRGPEAKGEPDKSFATAEEAIGEWKRINGRAPDHTWPYHDASGEVVGYVLRWDLGRGKKDVKPVALHGDRWLCKGMPDGRPLVGLPELRKLPPGTRVFVVEGEKCVDAARRLGLTATTSAHGSGSAAQADWSHLAHLEVVVLPDNDPEGVKYAEGVLELAGRDADSVRVLDLKAIWPDLPPKGDLADLVGWWSGSDEDLCDAIHRLADATAALPPPQGDALPEPLFETVTAYSLIREFPKMRPVVVQGLLREGEVMNLVAAPKVGKSHLAHLLAGAVAMGVPWLGHETRKGRVLIVDAELHRETLAQRLRRVQNDLSAPEAVMRDIDLCPVRGKRCDIDQVERAVVAQYKPGELGLIILDALYRFLPANVEENSNESMTYVYNLLDAIAEYSGAAVVAVHHTSKGIQADKAVTDIGSGAGAQSRAADTHVVLRPHEVDGAVVVDAAVRSFAPINAFVVRNLQPGWRVDPDLDPKQLRRSARNQPASVKADSQSKTVESWTPEMFAKEVVGSDMLIREDIFARAKDEHGLSKTQAEGLLKRAEDARLIYRHIAGPSASHRFSTTPPDQLDLGGGEGGCPNPPPPGVFAPGGVGGSARPPSPPCPPPNLGDFEGSVQ